MRKPKPDYRITQNPKLKKAQIMLGEYNVAVAEFYDNSADAQRRLGAMFDALAGIAEPVGVIANARAALKMGIDEILYLRKELGRPDKPESLIVANIQDALDQITPKP